MLTKRAVDTTYGSVLKCGVYYVILERTQLLSPESLFHMKAHDGVKICEDEKKTEANTAMMFERQKALPLEAPQSCKAISAWDDKFSFSAATFCTCVKVRQDTVVEPLKKEPRAPKGKERAMKP